MDQTTEQQRAAHAWRRVNEAAALPAMASNGHATFGEYAQLLQGLPVGVHTAGLGPTVAFHLAKAKREGGAGPHGRVLADLADWLLTAPWLPTADGRRGDPTPRALMDALVSRPSRDYRALTLETYAYLSWLKRFAAAHPDAPGAPDSPPPSDAPTETDAR